MDRSESRARRAVCPLVTLLALSTGACGNSPPEVRAGDWRAVTEFGTFTFTISPDGAAIANVEYAFRCGDNTFSSASFRMGDPTPLEGRKLAFSVWVAGQLPMADWKGTFSRDGGTLKGALDLLGELCHADFEITR